MDGAMQKALLEAIVDGSLPNEIALIILWLTAKRLMQHLALELINKKSRS